MHFEPKDEGLTRCEAALHLVHRVRHALIQHGFGFKGVALSGGGGFGSECGNAIRPFALGVVADLGDAFNAAADLHCFSMWPLVSLPRERWVGWLRISENCRTASVFLLPAYQRTPRSARPGRNAGMPGITAPRRKPPSRQPPSAPA